MFVKPGPGLKVRIPHTHELLPDEGRDVPETQFWLRRVACGDVVLVDQSSAPSTVHEGSDA